MSFLLRPALSARNTPTLARAFSATPKPQIARMTVIGRLAASPESVEYAENKSLVKYALGTNHGKGDQKKVSWFKVASFVEGPQKEYLMGLPKGTLLYVDADARMEAYTDKEGIQRSNLSLIARNFDVLTRPRTEEAAETNDEGLVQ